MMLRTTISRIKKVCTVSFVPRLLRGDQRCAPVSYAVIRKAPRSTKCTDDDHNNKRGKYCDGSCESDEYMFISDKEPKIQDQNKSDGGQRLAEEMLNITPMGSPNPLPLRETRCEECQRIIDQAFGKEDLMEPILGEQYFSHSVNLDQTRREITEAESAKLKLYAESKLDKPVTDDRIQFGVFMKNRELLKDGASMQPECLIMNEATLKGAKESAKSTETMDELGLVQHTLNIHLTSPKEKMINADPIQTFRNEKLNLMYDDINDETLPLRATIAKADIDKYVYNQEKRDNERFRDTLNPKRHFNTTNIAEDTESRQNGKHFRKTKQRIRGKRFLYSTTAKENEEQLTQKIEQIDETPLVEAEKPKIEGFNIDPKILGSMDPTFKCFRDKVMDNHHTGASSENVPASFDEVAKRCLDIPTGKIDEILLKEMEKLGIPIAKRESHARSPVIEEDLVQMDVLKKQQKRPVEKRDLDLESHEYEREAIELCSHEALVPSRYMCNEKILPDTEKDSNDLKDVAYIQCIGEELLKIKPNQVLIDPYDTNTIAHDTEEYDTFEMYDPSKVFSHYYVPEKKIAESKINAMSNHLNDPADLAVMDTKDNIWGAEPFNPAHLTGAARTTKPLSIDPPDISRNVKESGINLLVKEQNYAKQDKETINRDLDYKQRILNYALKISQSKSSPDLSIPDGSFHEKLSSANAETTNSSLAYYNKTNINVSDGIWDGPLDPEPSTKQDQNDSKLIVSNEICYEEKIDPRHVLTCNETCPIAPSPQVYAVESVRLADAEVSNEIWNEEKLDPRHVLTCNETCPIAPRPQVYAVESVRLADTEAIFDENFLEPQFNFSDKFGQPSRCSDDQTLSTQERMKKVSLFLKPRPSCDNFTDIAIQKKMPKLSRFLKTEATLSPLVDEDAASKSMLNSMPATMPETLSMPESLNTLPKLNEDVSLSELLRRVRERSRILECKNELKTMGVLVDPVEGKCGRKAPRCAPLAPRSPPPNPIPPPTFGLPQLKPRPPACKPRKKPQTTKCSNCKMDVSSGIHCGPKINAHEPVGCSEMVYESKDAGAEVNVKSPESKANLTDEVIGRLQTLGKILGGAIRRGHADILDSGSVMTNRRGAKILLARDYEPWAPIPSWPTPQKAECDRKKPECTPGCKIFPPTRSSHDPPCEQRPCNYPKKTFSLLDCFSVSLGENKVYDLGEF